MTNQNPQESINSHRLSPVVKNPCGEDFGKAQNFISTQPNPLADLNRKEIPLTPTVMLTTCPRKQNTKRQEFGFHSEFTVCDVCGKSIKRNYIKDHIKTHDAAVTKFQCKFRKFEYIFSISKSLILGDLCGLSFKIKGYLYSHMRNMHVSTKRFQCNVCGKSFAKVNQVLLK